MNRNWQAAWFSLAALALWVFWGWSQNGRWAAVSLASGPYGFFVLDTRSGDLHYGSERIVPPKEATKKVGAGPGADLTAPEPTSAERELWNLLSKTKLLRSEAIEIWRARRDQTQFQQALTRHQAYIPDDLLTRINEAVRNVALELEALKGPMGRKR